MRWCSLRWPMTGSMAAHRLNSRLICGGTRPLAARVDLELVIGWGVVAAIAGISDAAIKQYNMPTYPHKRWQFATTATLRPPRFSGFRRREAELFPTRGVKLPCLSTRSQSFVDVAFRPDLGALRKSPACPRPTPKNQ